MPKVNPQSRFGRLVQWMSRQGWFRVLFGPAVIPRVDRLLYRVTRGRLLLGAMILDSVLLTTTGRKSGQERSVPVAYFWVDGARVVVGTNFGRPGHPAWALNLAADARARIAESGVTTQVVAHLVEGAERDRVWGDIVRQWPPFETYEATMGDRQAMVFRLQPM